MPTKGSWYKTLFLYLVWIFQLHSSCTEYLPVLQERRQKYWQVTQLAQVLPSMPTGQERSLLCTAAALNAVFPCKMNSALLFWVYRLCSHSLSLPSSHWNNLIRAGVLKSPTWGCERQPPRLWPLWQTGQTCTHKREESLRAFGMCWEAGGRRLLHTGRDLHRNPWGRKEGKLLHLRGKGTAGRAEGFGASGSNSRQCLTPVIPRCSKAKFGLQKFKDVFVWLQVKNFLLGREKRKGAISVSPPAHDTNSAGGTREAMSVRPWPWEHGQFPNSRFGLLSPKVCMNSTWEVDKGKVTFLVLHQKNQQNGLKSQAGTQPMYLLSGFGSLDKNDTGLKSFTDNLIEVTLRCRCHQFQCSSLVTIILIHTILFFIYGL